METTISVTVWTMVVSMANGAPMYLPTQYMSYEECAADLARVRQPSAQCIASSTTTVPLPGEITNRLRDGTEAEAKAAKGKK